MLFSDLRVEEGKRRSRLRTRQLSRFNWHLSDSVRDVYAHTRNDARIPKPFQPQHARDDVSDTEDIEDQSEAGEEIDK